MTQHPSLKIKDIGIGHRSVLKRFERILRLKKEEKWKEGDPIFGLPKVKNIRTKIKKEKPAAAAVVPGAAPAGVPEGAAAGTGTPAATAAPTGKPTEAPAGAKTEIKAKPPAAKTPAKEAKKKK